MNNRYFQGLRHAAVLAMLGVLLCASPAFAQTGGMEASTPDIVAQAMPANERGARLRVGTKHAPPFVVDSGDGRFSGVSIVLWQAVAERLGIEYDYVPSDLAGLFSGLENGELDLSVAALTVTAPREAHIDFSYPFYSTGLAIAVPANDGSAVWATVRRFFSWQFFTALAALALLLMAVGVIIWLFERRANAEEFGGSTAQGLGSGFWWAAVTMTTVGYGDKSPRTLGGRLIGLVWMFAAIIIISSFTAAIATSLTVDRLASGIKGVQDLADARVVTVDGSAAAEALRDRGIAFSARPELEDGLAALAAGRVDAVVYDAPLLNYRVKNEYGDTLSVLESIFDRQDYAFAMPEGSDLREPINRAILEYLASDAWRDTLTQYLGSQP
ncbi:transporter substrate-binding domain-containing protein [Salinisphaera sp.]|uniref:transporter substrate-binding domain-containing protein n=1 Tax=Salinisphaera sp. TaxID=1914330 RepID=UPI000C39FD14|nr:transporter substrate-binding domain-containing protein [Salinisphaera sp.]MBS62971.1 ABC transporter substrate-binding protein [Salinisphaera sp.]